MSVLGRSYGILLFIQEVSDILVDLDTIHDIVSSIVSISSSDIHNVRNAFIGHILLELLRSKFDDIWRTETSATSGVAVTYGRHVWQILSLASEQHGFLQNFRGTALIYFILFLKFGPS